MARDMSSGSGGGAPCDRIGPLVAEHEAAWTPLYRAYATFYGVPISDESLARTWAWLMDGNTRRLEGLAAHSGEGVLVGIAHFRAVPDPLLGRYVGFLDDLFVAPEARGQGFARRLIEAVAAIARDRGWPRVQWLTATDNTASRALYDQLAQATPWMTYELTVMAARDL